jgi:hypothetical protein
MGVHAGGGAVLPGGSDQCGLWPDGGAGWAADGVTESLVTLFPCRSLDY